LFTDTEESTHASLHSNVLPACFGIAPEESIENIKNHIMQKGLCCGVWFSYFVLKALAKMGAYEEEYQLIVNRTEHSWYNMISEGATTCYEAWGKEQKFNTSLCHPWASSPIIWRMPLPIPITTTIRRASPATMITKDNCGCALPAGCLPLPAGGQGRQKIW
jgi:hypothetical protein